MTAKPKKSGFEAGMRAFSDHLFMMLFLTFAYFALWGVMTILFIVGVALPQMKGEVPGLLSAEVGLWETKTCSLATGICSSVKTSELCSTAGDRLRAAAGLGIVSILAYAVSGGMILLAGLWSKFQWLALPGMCGVWFGLATGLVTWALPASVYRSSFCGIGGNPTTGFRDTFGSTSLSAGFILLVVAWCFLFVSNTAFAISFGPWITGLKTADEGAKKKKGPF